MAGGGGGRWGLGCQREYTGGGGAVGDGGCGYGVRGECGWVESARGAGSCEGVGAAEKGGEGSGGSGKLEGAGLTAGRGCGGGAVLGRGWFWEGL